MSVFLTDLDKVLSDAGLRVVTAGGWKTRGYKNMGLSSVRGIVLHHTATAWTKANEGDSYPSYTVVKDGRADLPGPLAQLGLGRDGTWYVLAAGYANHVGTAAVGETNSVCLGIEAEASGTGDKRDWPTVQYDAYVTGVRALYDHYGANFIKGHKEVALPKGRKSDPSFDMVKFRDAVHSGLPRELPYFVEVGRNYTNRPTKDIQKLVGATPDNLYGRDTTLRVLAWQTMNGLEPDGLWGVKSDAVGFPPTIKTNGATVQNLTPTVTTAASGVSLRVLKRGMTGNDVKILQSALRKSVKAEIPITGGFYNLTEFYLKKFQQKYGLTVTGVCDKATYGQLKKLGVRF